MHVPELELRRPRLHEAVMRVIHPATGKPLLMPGTHRASGGSSHAIRPAIWPVKGGAPVSRWTFSVLYRVAYELQFDLGRQTPLRESDHWSTLDKVDHAPAGNPDALLSPTDTAVPPTVRPLDPA